MQSVLTISKVVRLNLLRDEIYLIQHYVIALSNVWHVGVFIRVFVVATPMQLTTNIYNWN